MAELTADDARRVLEEETKRRMQQCQHVINEALRRCKCDLVAVPYLTPDGRIAARAQLVDVSGKPPRSPA